VGVADKGNVDFSFPYRWGRREGTLETLFQYTSLPQKCGRFSIEIAKEGYCSKVLEFEVSTLERGAGFLKVDIGNVFLVPTIH